MAFWVSLLDQNDVKHNEASNENHLGFDDSSEFCNHRRCLLLPAFTKVPH